MNMEGCQEKKIYLNHLIINSICTVSYLKVSSIQRIRGINDGKVFASSSGSYPLILEVKLQTYNILYSSFHYNSKFIIQIIMVLQLIH